MNIQTILNIQHDFYPLAVLLILTMFLVWIKDKRKFFVFTSILLLSIIFTGIGSVFFHGHFYNWGRLHFGYNNNLYLSSLLLNSYIKKGDSSDFNELIDTSFKMERIVSRKDNKEFQQDGQRGTRQYFSHNIKITSPNGTDYTYSQSNLKGERTQSYLLEVSKDGYKLEMLVKEKSRTWINSYTGYLKALMRGEVIYSKPYAKYPDFFLLNISIALFLYTFFMHIRLKAGVREINKIQTIVRSKMFDSSKM